MGIVVVKADNAPERARSVDHKCTALWPTRRGVKVVEPFQECIFGVVMDAADSITEIFESVVNQRVSLDILEIHTDQVGGTPTNGDPIFLVGAHELTDLTMNHAPAGSVIDIIGRCIFGAPYKTLDDALEVVAALTRRILSFTPSIGRRINADCRFEPITLDVLDRDLFVPVKIIEDEDGKDTVFAPTGEDIRMAPGSYIEMGMNEVTPNTFGAAGLSAIDTPFAFVVEGEEKTYWAANITV